MQLSFVMYPCKQLETSDQACFQDLAPATPSHSQQDDASPALQSEREVSSGSKREDSQQQNSVPVQADLCRADLSGAALLIVQELAAFRSSEESNIAVGKDSRSPFRQKKAFGNGNYNRYYGYRLAKGETEDPRLQVWIASLTPSSSSSFSPAERGCTSLRLESFFWLGHHPCCFCFGQNLKQIESRLLHICRPESISWLC